METKPNAKYQPQPESHPELASALVRPLSSKFTSEAHSMASPTAISVIIPTHNRAYCLERAVRSCLRQTHLPAELIVVDDASTDGTEHLVRALQETSPLPIHYLRQTHNSGVSHARNVGIARATSPWLAFLDSDDEWLPHRLQAQVAGWRTSPGILAWHGDEIWIRHGRRVNPMKKHKKQGGWIFSQCVPLCVISPSAALIHREIFAQIGCFDEQFAVCEDYELWLRLTSLFEVGFCSAPILIKHGGHSDQLSRRFVAMDYWRVKALDRILQLRPRLTAEERSLVKKTLREKSQILLQGYRKHDNMDHYSEIEALRHKHEPASF